MIITALFNKKNVPFFKKVFGKLFKKNSFLDTLFRAIKKHGNKMVKTMGKTEKKYPGLIVAVGTAAGAVVGHVIKAHNDKYPVVEHAAVVEIGDGNFTVQAWPGLYKLHVDTLDDTAMKRILYQLKSVRADIVDKTGGELVDVRIVCGRGCSIAKVRELQRSLVHEGFFNISIDYPGIVKHTKKEAAAK